MSGLLFATMNVWTKVLYKSKDGQGAGKEPGGLQGLRLPPGHIPPSQLQRHPQESGASPGKAGEIITL